MNHKRSATLWVRTSSFSHPNDSVGKLILQHPFTRKVQTILPTPSSRPTTTPRVTDISAFYYVLQAGMSFLATETFIHRSIVDAAFHCLSVGSKHSLSVTPDGHLHLVLPETLCQTAGLQGSLINGTDQYHVDVKLTGESFVQGSLYHDLVTRGLARLPGPVQLLCARACNEDITEVNFIGLDGIASVECLAHDYQVQELQAAAPTTECWQQIIADMAAANTTGKEQDADHASDMTDRLHELYEWMGAISCGITDLRVDAMSGEQSNSAHLTCDSWQGLILPCQVHKALQSAREQVRESACPWAIVSAWGFMGHPVTWLDSAPASGSMAKCENDFSVVVLPDDQYILFVASGSADSFKKV